MWRLLYENLPGGTPGGPGMDDAAHVSGFQTPDQVRFVDSLPRTSVGKLNKRAMREGL